jgi:hypothetical protein
LSIRQTTRDIISLVEEQSGIPVRVVEDPKLQTLATVRIARKGVTPDHVVIYKPQAGEAPDYRICFECVYILRLFSNPPDRRFDLAETTKGQEDVEQTIMSPGGIASQYRLRKSQVQELRAQFLSGLLIHLRSVPVGLRASEWLAENYPDLKQLEGEHVKNELNLGKQSMAANIKQITPPKVFRAAQGISAAYALYWSEKYGKPEVFNPYRLQGFEKDGRALLDIFERTPDDPTYDQALIDGWAKHLEISDWYTWVPYQPPV